MSAATSRGLEGRPSLTETLTIPFIRAVIESVRGETCLICCWAENVLKQHIYIRQRLDITYTLRVLMGSETKQNSKTIPKQIGTVINVTALLAPARRE
jgi:hypothetical protein